MNMIFKDKYIKAEELARVIAAWKAAGEKVALAIGCFDMLHVGCVRFLAGAADHVDRLVVGVLDDEGVRVTRGDGRPVMRHEHRMDMVAAIERVDAVAGLPLADMPGRIEEFDADVVIIGADHPEIEKAVPPKFKDEGRLVIVEKTSDICSDWLVRQIKAQVAREQSSDGQDD